MTADNTAAKLRRRETRSTKGEMAKPETRALPIAADQSPSSSRPIKRIGAFLVLSAVILSSVFRPNLLPSVQLPNSITHCFHSQSIEKRVNRILSTTPLIGMRPPQPTPLPGPDHSQTATTTSPSSCGQSTRTRSPTPPSPSPGRKAASSGTPTSPACAPARAAAPSGPSSGSARPTAPTSATRCTPRPSRRPTTRST